MRKASQALTHRMRTAEAVHSLCVASLLILPMTTRDDPWVMLPLAAALPLVLARRQLVQSPHLWALLFVAIGIRQLLTWHTLDDHTIAMTYWCGALALGLGARQRHKTLAYSARLIIGLIFLFAAGWKIFSGQFADGTFFRHTLLFDDRFATIADSLGQTTERMRMENISRVNSLLSYPDGATASLVEGANNRAIAATFTAWGIFIESAVAATFLLPIRRNLAWLRHAALVSFAATTYLLVPIGGFGAFLLVLASATVTTWRARWGYYAGAIALTAWAGVWPLVFH